MRQFAQRLLNGTRGAVHQMHQWNQRRRQWYWSLVRWQRILVSSGISLVIILIVFPTIGWLAGLTYTPSGWQNANVPTRTGLFTNNSLNSIAIGTSIPGLMLGCVNSFDLVNQSAAVWRSRDYGQHWETLATPFQIPAKNSCLIISPSGDQAVFFVLINRIQNGGNPEPLWVTHDQGNTWQLAENSLASLTNFDKLSNSFFRDGRFYTLGYFTGKDNTLIVSDDGLTWYTTEVQPSILEAQGWIVGSIAPDYQNAHGWLRVMNNPRSLPLLPPMLEQSTDDGQHWQAVGNLGNRPMEYPILATSPTQPQRLCASNSLFSFKEASNDDPLSLLASSDGGLTWHEANSMPHVPASLNGDTSQSGVFMEISMGADGSCYQLRNYAWDKGDTSGGFSQETQVLQMAPQARSVIQLADLPGWSANLGLHSPFAYVPDTHHNGHLFVDFEHNFGEDWWHSLWDFIGLICLNPPPSQPLYWLPVT